MKLLPYYFKKIGLWIFLLAGIPDLVHGYKQGYNASAETDIFITNSIFGIHFTPGLFTIFSVISMVGLILFAFSRDKGFDEFLGQLRMESIHLTIFFSALIILFVLILGNGLNVDAIAFMQGQMILFLVIYKIKKSNVKADAEAGV